MSWEDVKKELESDEYKAEHARSVDILNSLIRPLMFIKINCNIHKSFTDTLFFKFIIDDLIHSVIGLNVLLDEGVVNSCTDCPKLLNLALEYPIIFIGYSLEDENVLKIFETLIESLNEEQLLTLSENLIYVEWEPHEELLKESKKSVNRLGKSLEMTCISTDNYFVLYKHLMKFVPAEKPERVRKYKKMIQKIILNNNSGKATIVTNDDLDKLNSEGKLVIAFGKHDQFARMGIIGIKVEDIITWVLEQKKDIGEDYANDIFEYFYMTSRVQSNHYVPMFYLCKFTDKYNNTEKLMNMKSNLVSWVDKIINDKNLKIYKNIKEAHDDSGIQSISYYLKSIVKTYSQGKMNYLECLDILNKLNEKQSLLKNTDFRKAVTYLDLKK